MRGIIKQILDNKGREVLMTSESTSLYDCARAMVNAHVGSLLVCEGEHIKGMLYERDLSRLAITGKLDMVSAKARDVMKTTIPVVTSSTSVLEAMSVFTRERVRHLPVIDEGTLQGLVSIGDVTKWVLDSQEQEIQHLVSYIQGDFRVKFQ